MDNNEIGPVTGSEPIVNNDTSNLHHEITELKKEKEKLEADFGQKRAVFMDLYRQKEDEIGEARQEMTEAIKKSEGLEEQVRRLQVEIDDIKTATAMSEVAKEEDIMEIQRKCDEEIKSLQHIMREAVQQAHIQAAEKFQQEHAKLIMGYEKLEKELTDTKTKLHKEREEGFLTAVTKTLQKKVSAVGVGGALAGQSQSEQESLEDSMKKAQEDAEILKSVVLPLEEEIQKLQDQLQKSYGKIAHFEGKSVDEVMREAGSSPTPREGSPDTDERLKELSQSLEVEKASRSDLEMYVAVLTTQKNVITEDNEKLMNQLQDVVKILEQERQEHNNLKHTWQMANDQFLQSQRLLMEDMRRMEGVLSAEQQRQITEMKKKEADEESLAKKARGDEEATIPEEVESQLGPSSDHVDACIESQATNSKGSMTSLTSDELSKIEEETSISIATPNDSVALTPPPATQTLPRSQSNQSLQSITKELFDSGMHDARSLQDEPLALRLSPERVHHLTEAQQKAITDPTPEAEASQSLIASIKAKAETFSTVGKRLVSENEWDMLQKEVSVAREKLGRPCDMCHNYEDQLQVIQDSEKKAQGQIRTLERHLQAERQAMANQTNYTEELEETLKTAAEDAHAQISELVLKIGDLEKITASCKTQHIRDQTDLQHHLRTLTGDREKVQKELSHLQDENDSLVSKHSKHAQQLQEEDINLPNNLEDMQLLLLKYREEIISAKVAKEHIEENLRSELLFLKDQLLCEQQEKSNLEEAMSQEISQLQHEIDENRHLKSDLQKVSQEKAALDVKVKDTGAHYQSTLNKNQLLITTLTNQNKEFRDSKEMLQQELTKLRVKVSSLQVDLDNSEAVQRDFVKLSQSLQIQLEKIRSAEHEVRWQHEEDAEDCSNCRLSFSVTRRKHHCRHCGRIFCNDCIPKVVNHGPNLRPSRVCEVCHTILVRDATPYFSTELPQTPH